MGEERRLSQGESGLNRLRRVFGNPVSLIGLALAVVGFGNFLFLWFLDVTSTHPSPYIVILAYMVAPAFLILGLALVAFGAWYDRRKRSSDPGKAIRYLTIDFNDPSQRGAVAFLSTFLIAFIGLSAMGSYKAYEFTDSVQ